MLCEAWRDEMHRATTTDVHGQSLHIGVRLFWRCILFWFSILITRVFVRNTFVGKKIESVCFTMLYVNFSC